MSKIKILLIQIKKKSRDTIMVARITQNGLDKNQINKNLLNGTLMNFDSIFLSLKIRESKD